MGVAAVPQLSDVLLNEECNCFFSLHGHACVDAAKAHPLYFKVTLSPAFECAFVLH